MTAQDYINRYSIKTLADNYRKSREIITVIEKMKADVEQYPSYMLIEELRKRGFSGTIVSPPKVISI